jgi:hypothetical protein
MNNEEISWRAGILSSGRLTPQPPDQGLRCSGFTAKERRKVGALHCKAATCRKTPLGKCSNKANAIGRKALLHSDLTHEGREKTKPPYATDHVFSNNVIRTKRR